MDSRLEHSQLITRRLDTAEAAAYANVMNMLLNMDEVLTKE